ncbi:hypothetical protein BG015_011016 [Linnemannia schmuckeri]|uniref:Uncharacterized protein n=1 Tax=Linnemannia schmuckeri TaxID=64567 RepID=A0A9P5V8P0_9FUNG|nr:hypothetical protein BG015_011016 [Linnemannia schmuckeri]
MAAPAQAANTLKRKSPPVFSERPSATVKRTVAAKIYAHAPHSELHPDTLAFLQQPGTLDGDGIGQDNQDEEDDYQGEDHEEEEEDEESCDETETNSSRSDADDEVEEEQPQLHAEPMAPPRRQLKFPGFNKAMELVLLKGLNAVKPFGAQYGETADAWARVVRYLKEDDDKERARGKEARFDLVNARNCKEKWLALSAEYAAMAAKSLRDSGTNPTIDARYTELQEAYLYEQTCLNTKKEKKSRRHHAQAQATLNKTNGEHLMVASRTGPVRGRTVEGQQTALAHSSCEDLPLQLSAGFLSGTESDASQSTSTSSQHKPPRTPGMKKRAMGVMVTNQLTLAAEAMKDQREHNNQHLAFLREDREERRKTEEARIQREEARIQREEARIQREEALKERQQDTITKLIEAQTVISERIAKQQTESTERLFQAMIQLIQRK